MKFSRIRLDESLVEVVGITSQVRINKRTVGHVAFFDFDKVDMEDIIAEFSLRPALFVFESSKGKFHGIQPIVRTRRATMLYLLGKSIEDRKHAVHGFQKDSWALRTSGKGTKPKPQFKRIVGDFKGYKDRILSRPHVKYLANMVRETPRKIVTTFKEGKLIGDSLKMVKYVTFGKKPYKGGHKRDF